MSDGLSSAARWIFARCDAKGFKVSRCVPAGFPVALQIRHPLLVPASEAQRAGLARLHGEAADGSARIPWDALVGARENASNRTILVAARTMEGSGVSIAWLGSSEVAALVDHIGSNVEVTMYWDLVSSRMLGERTSNGTSEQWLRFVCDHELDEDPELSPTYVWPVERSWIVWTDPDLAFSVLACSDALASRVQQDDRVDTVAISTDALIADL